MSRQSKGTPPSARRRRGQGINGAGRLESLERRALLSGTPITAPDGFGYRAYEHAYEPIDLVANVADTVAILDNIDDGFVNVSLGGNTFRYYDQTYTSLYVSTNGLSTSNFNSSFSNTDLTTGETMIAPLWDDWRTDAGAGEVLRRFDDLNGDGTHDRLVIEWSDVRGYVSPTTGSPSAVTFQLILLLNTGNHPGDVVFNYVDTISDDFRNDGASATVGIKAAGNQGPNRLLVSYNTTSPYVGSGKAILVSKNRPPTLDPGGPYQVSEGGTVALTATGTDPDGDSLVYAWDLDRNGTFETSGATVDFSAAGLDGPADASSTIAVPVQVSDQRGQVVTKSAAVTVTNVAPIVSLSGETSVDEGSQYALTLGPVVDPGPETVMEFVVRWGDGATETIPAAQLPSDRTLYHTYADGPADVDVEVDVVDEDGTHSNAGSETVTVNNVAPTVALSGPAALNEGGVFALVFAPTADAAAAADMVVDDGTLYAVQWDDGIYYDDGLIAEPLYVTDSDSGTVTPAPAAVVDPGADTVLEFVVHWGDGTWDIITAAELPTDRTLYHVYTDNRAEALVSVDVVDEDGIHHNAGSTIVAVHNVAPTIALTGPASVDEGGQCDLVLGAVTDPGADSVESYVINWGDGSSETVTAESLPVDRTLRHTYADGAAGGTVRTIAVSLVDEDGTHADAGSVTTTVNNVAPLATFTAITGTGAGYVVAAGVPVGFQGAFTDPGAGDTHTAVWEISDDNFSTLHFAPAGSVDPPTRTVTGGFTFSKPGVYKVRLVVSDDDGGTGAADRIGDLEATVVVYDATAGFVTGGGWINSPAGSYAADPSLTGKAQFAFVSKYKAGSPTPVGTTQFLFRAAGLHFSSFSYDFMVISGHKAQFRGAGTLNGQAGYRFKLTAIDGKRAGGGGLDKFRIQIWNGSNTLIYDNQRTYDPVTNTWVSAEEDTDPTTLLGGGSIVIHS